MHPWGFPWLEGAALQKALDGNEFVKFSIRFCDALHLKLAIFLLEHPEDLGATRWGDQPASIWQLGVIQELAKRTKASTAAFHQCDPELSGESCAMYPKPTRLLGTAALLDCAPFIGWPYFDTSAKYLGPLPVDCGHVHTTPMTATRGEFRSGPSAAYPSRVCAWIAKLLLGGGGARPLTGMAGSFARPASAPSATSSSPPGPPPARLWQSTGDQQALRDASGAIVGEGHFLENKKMPHDSEWQVSPKVDAKPAGPENPFKGPVPLPGKIADTALQMLSGTITERCPSLHLAGRALTLGATKDSDGKLAINDGSDLHPELAATLNVLVRRAAARLDIRFAWTSIQINFGTTSGWHTDRCAGPVLLLGLGHYEGGAFQIQGSPPMDLQSRAILFSGSVPHCTHSYTGRKCTIAAYVVPWVHELSLDHFVALERLGFCVDKEKGDDTSEDDEDGARRVTLEEAIHGRPPALTTRWGGRRRPFHDGAGLCSPFRWPPEDRPQALQEKSPALIEALRGIVLELQDPVKSICKMATRHATASPFSEEQLRRARAAFSSMIGMAEDQAEKVVEFQPFHLDLLGGVLQYISDPDWRQAAASSWSFAKGVPIGVGIKMPRTPAVFERKVAWKSLDESDFNPDQGNYKSASLVIESLERQFQEEADEGMMFKASEEQLRRQYPGNRLRIAALGAIQKNETSFRVVHDGTHGVRVNNAVRPRDQVRMPGPGEARTLLERASRDKDFSFLLAADVSKAHRRILNRKEDWGLQACRTRPSEVWVNRVGTFGIGSACYWWARLAALVARVAGSCAGRAKLWQLIYADDVLWSAAGPRKFLDILLMILVWECFGTPIAWKKTKGGLQCDWLGYWLDFQRFQLGISEARAKWIHDWLARTVERGMSVIRVLREALGRLGFAAGVLEWHRPFLAPLYSWTSAAPPSACLPHPPAVQLALVHLRDRFADGQRLVSCVPMEHHGGLGYFTDASADDVKIVIGGWEARPGRALYECRWFSLEVSPVDAPWFFALGKGPKIIAAAELLATTVCLALFAPDAPAGARGKMTTTSAFTDNRGNTYAAAKLHSTKYPLSCVVMELAVQMEIKGIWVDLHWTPREQNQHADALTNGRFDSFDPALRLASVWAEVPFVALEGLLKVGADLAQQAADFRASNQRPKEAKTRREKRLRVTEPW